MAFNAIMRQSHLPIQKKIAKLYILRSQAIQKLRFRLIYFVSSLSIVWKVFEKLRSSKIKPFLEESNSLPNHTIKQSLENKNYWSADVTQAFAKFWLASRSTVCNQKYAPRTRQNNHIIS